MPVAFILVALFALKHFLANDPLQCRYTVKGLAQTNWILPMCARASVHSVLTLVLVLGYWIKMGKEVAIPLLLGVMAIDFLSHFALDRARVSKEFFGRFQVASAEDLAQMSLDYQSKNPAVVKAAQLRSESNKLFWWSEGFLNLMYALWFIEMAFLVQ
jgi:hypothetical protein